MPKLLEVERGAREVKVEREARGARVVKTARVEREAKEARAETVGTTPLPQRYVSLSLFLPTWI
jgi:hypothetical protein